MRTGYHPSGRPLVVYVLGLQCGKYYVGITTNFERRMEQHFTNEGISGAQWTRKYKALRVIEITSGMPYEFENDKTLECMQKYGWENVRGGSWCHPNMQESPLVQKELSIRKTDLELYKEYYSLEAIKARHIQRMLEESKDVFNL